MNKTDKDTLRRLQSIFEDKDTTVIAEALGTLAKECKLIGSIAKKAHVNTNSLYRSLSRSGNPSFRIINITLHTLGYQLTVTPLKH